MAFNGMSEPEEDWYVPRRLNLFFPESAGRRLSSNRRADRSNSNPPTGNRRRTWLAKNCRTVRGREDDATRLPVDGQSVDEVEYAIGLRVAVRVKVVQVQDAQQRKSFDVGTAFGNEVHESADAIILIQYIQSEFFLRDIEAAE